MRTPLDLATELREYVVKATGQKSKTRPVSKTLDGYIRDDRLKRPLQSSLRKRDFVLDDAEQV